MMSYTKGTKTDLTEEIDTETKANKNYEIKTNILQSYTPKKPFKGDVIGKISSSNYYVNKNERIEFLAQDLTHNQDIPAVGVVNDEGELVGIIIKRELFDLLGRPYGRDVYYYRNIELITKKVTTFRFEENIYSTGDKLKEELYQQETKFYVLTTGDNKFAGLFSTKDLLMYLSEMSQRDIRFATDIQHRIIKESIHNNEYCELFGASKMAKGVGGDFYAVKKYNETNWLIMIIDVSGKGIPAALVTAVIGGMFSIYDLNKGIRNFVTSLNEHLLNTFQLDKFATGIFLDFNERTGEIIVYDCGHSHLYLYRKNKFSKLKIKNGNLPLGITPNINPQASRYVLQKNDLLLSFTDGIDEQSNSDGDEYGIVNMIPILSKNKSKSLKSLKDELFADVKSFRGSKPQHDDMTLIMMKKF